MAGHENLGISRLEQRKIVFGWIDELGIVHYDKDRSKIMLRVVDRDEKKIIKGRLEGHSAGFIYVKSKDKGTISNIDAADVVGVKKGFGPKAPGRGDWN